MATVQLNDISIYYEEHGSGEPLLIIGGLANTVQDYTQRSRIVSLLAEKYRVITFDNRGAGQTDKPDIPYSIAMMADDTAQLLHALNIKQAYILGVSMGGRIALDLAVRYPKLVNKLILVSTGSRSVKTFKRLVRIDLLPRIPFFRKEFHHPYYAFNRQRKASGGFNHLDILHTIQIPTLILHGNYDAITPKKLAEEIHEKIPGSKLKLFDGGHLFLFRHQQKFVHTVVAFLN